MATDSTAKSPSRTDRVTHWLLIAIGIYSPFSANPACDILEFPAACGSKKVGLVGQAGSISRHG
jgi:hypothetical protein